MKNAPKIEIFPPSRKKYDDGEIVIWNKYKRFGDVNDRLAQIVASNYKRPKGRREGWYYNAEIQKIAKTRSPGVPEIIIQNGFVREIPEDQIFSREEILKY